jgi:tRNA (mo5U34)-methyltransferase
MLNTVKWYHEFDLPNGLKAEPETEDLKFHRNLWKFIEQHLNTIDFKNKSVLDVGCWDGYWSFYAEQRGARRVLATDDLSQNWCDGRGIHMIKKALNSNIEIKQDVSAYNLVSLNKKFDIILFLGIHYHLQDPYFALAQLRHMCNKDAVVVIEGNVGINCDPQSAKYSFGDVTQSTFEPSEQLLNRMLRATYFKTYYEKYFAVDILKARTHLIDKPYADRKFIICKPIVENNPTHVYKPAFGLWAFDTRWNNEI